MSEDVVDSSNPLRSDCVPKGVLDLKSAAIAAAFGAAADVPKNGRAKPPAPVTRRPRR